MFAEASWHRLRDLDGAWYIPHSTVRLARSAAGLSTGAKAAGKKKS